MSWHPNYSFGGAPYGGGGNYDERYDNNGEDYYHSSRSRRSSEDDYRRSRSRRDDDYFDDDAPPQETITTAAAARRHLPTIFPWNYPQLISMVSCRRGVGMSKDIISILPRRGISVMTIMSMLRHGKRTDGVSRLSSRMLLRLKS